MIEPTWSKTTKYLVGIGLVLLGILILQLSHLVIPSLIAAALIAVIVRPAIIRLQSRFHWPRGLAVGVIYLGMAILVPLVLMLILPMIKDALIYVGNLDYEIVLQNSVEWLRSTLTTIKAIQFPVAGFDGYVDRTVDILIEGLQPISSTAAVPPSIDAILQPLSSALMSVVQTGANLVGTVITQAAMIAFMFLASIYISLDAHIYRNAFLNAIPAAYQPEISTLLARIERLWNAFFHGEMVLMLVVGAITTIGLAALGVPGALYLGIIAGMLEIIPTLGPVFATVPAVIVALIQGSAYLPIGNLAFAGLVILFYILVQQVENNLIVPRVLGDALELPPLVVLTGIVVGASVGGILGALLATPVIATARVILHYVYRKMTGQNLIQVEAAAPETGTPPSGNSFFSQLRKRIRFRSPESRQGNGED
jgi:predicted PurR-regulated permease PerM